MVLQVSHSDCRKITLQFHSDRTATALAIADESHTNRFKQKKTKGN
jgi:hypothetical protein